MTWKRPPTARLLAVLCVLVATLAPVAATSAPKSYAQAEAAWHEGMLEESRALYEQAMAEGGLFPQEVVIAYSRIGTVKAALKDEQGALSDFRVAAAIDPKFELPADSGPIAKKLYTQARGEAAAQGEALSLTLELPKLLPVAKEFQVGTSIPEGFAVLVAEVVVTIEDPVSGKKWRRRKPAEPKLEFAFPDRVAIKGAKLKVTAAAVDAHDNAWVMAWGELVVEGERALATMEAGEVDPFAKDEPATDQRSRKKLLKGPMPWIVAGGVVLIGGTIAVVAATRPKRVEVGPPSWQ